MGIIKSRVRGPCRVQCLATASVSHLGRAPGLLARATAGSILVGPTMGRDLMGHAAMHLSHLRRLQEALEKIASDLDEIEGRSHARLRYVAQDLNDDGPARSIESCVSNFEIAVRGRLVN